MKSLPDIGTSVLQFCCLKKIYRQNKQTTSLPSAADNYVTIAEQAFAKVIGFKDLYQKLGRSINVTGKCKSAFTNYGRHNLANTLMKIVSQLCIDVFGTATAKFESFLVIEDKAYR
jgi:hypothetical protein